MNRISTWLAVVVGIITLLGGALGTAFTIDSRYAKSEEIAIIKDYVQQVDKRLELKKEYDDIMEKIKKDGD